MMRARCIFQFRRASGLLLAYTLFSCASLASAQTVGENSRFVWDYDPIDMQKIDGFKLYIDNEHVFTTINTYVNVSDIQLTVGSHTAYVTAYNAVAESASNILGIYVVTDAPISPTNFTIDLNPGI